jgi:hypothetical protein
MTVDIKGQYLNFLLLNRDTVNFELRLAFSMGPKKRWAFTFLNNSDHVLGVV